MSHRSSNSHMIRPARLRIFSWMFFSATAMLSAFILPVHFFSYLSGREMSMNTAWVRLYFIVLVVSALYHGFYRIKTIFFDLTLVKISRISGWIFGCLFLGLITLFIVTLGAWR